MNSEKLKALEIVTLTRVDGANLNSNGTEGVISVLKKVRDPVDMKEYVRVSGQSYKRQLRQAIMEIAGTDKISQREKPTGKVNKKGKEGKSVIVSAGNPVKYYDDDLFGYMLADVRKRVAPVRTSGFLSIFPYNGDRDFGVAYNPDPEVSEHNIFETELSTNVMRGNVFVELDRVGVFQKWELGGDDLDAGEKKEKLEDNEIQDRITTVLRAILDYHGGGHLSNYFTKVYPEAVAAVVLNRKIPIIGDAFKVKYGYQNGKMILDAEALYEHYKVFENYIDSMLVGLFESSFANKKELDEIFKGTKCEVLSMEKFRAKLLGTRLV